ncbi:unnamed protein product [Caenorhabditis angaria]|uniref:Uncharacterized protein n=1 Tax=Caenorhabditis angaria TaxID=860376 RepID=A0A9P1N367_9PELO|nr:unnamed protein product [Caenorhabditis angaria]
MSSEEHTTVSETVFTTSEEDGEEEELIEEVCQKPSKIFLLGFIEKSKHNSSLKSISADLLSNFFIASNSSSPEDSSINRQLLAKSDVLLFFINEQTLRDTTCLLTLQLAYLSQIPIIMLRPPLTKLMISNRDITREKEKISIIAKSAILRSPRNWDLINDDTKIDYNLLQDILYEGFKISILYDKQEHSDCISRIRHKLQNVITSTKRSESSITTSSGSQPHFYLSPSNHSISSIFSRNVQVDDSKRRGKSRSSSRRHKTAKSNDAMKLNLSLSTGNLSKIMRTPHPVKFTYDEELEGKHTPRHILKSPPPPDRIPSSIAVSDCGETEDIITKDNLEIDADKFPLPPLTPKTPSSALYHQNNTSSRSRPPLGSLTSLSSSCDRRMSLSCIEDLSNYQKTQYLVFPLRDSSKKPYLLKFPDDMHEEEEKHNGSVWGSDTSLEEEIKLAGTINAGIIVDQMDDSPIQSPAPYLGDLH